MNRWAEYTMWALAFSIPFYIKSSAALVALLVLIWLFIKPGSKWSLMKKNAGLIAALCAFYCVYVASLLWSANMDYGLRDIETKMSFAILPILLGTMPGLNRNVMHRVLLWLTAGCIAGALVCITGALISYGSEGDPDAFISSMLSLYLHPSYFALYCCVSIAFVLWWALQPDVSGLPNVRPAVKFATVLFLTVFVLILYSKTGMLTLMAVFFLTGVVYVVKKRSFAKGLIGLGLIMGLLVVSITWLVPNTSHRIQLIRDVLSNPSAIDLGSVESTAARVLVWQASVDLIADHGLTGVGTGDTKDVLIAKYLEEGMTGAAEAALNTHNQFLQTTIATGMAGLLVLLSMILWPFVVAVRHNFMLFGIFAGLMLVNLMTESMFEKQSGVIFYSFMNCLFLFGRSTDN